MFEDNSTLILNVGGNTYVTVEEANNYVTNMYPRQSTQYKNWFYEAPYSDVVSQDVSLTDGDREKLLLRACAILDSIPLKGIKSVETQALQFPKYPETSIVDRVKGAQIEVALELSNFDSLMDSTERRAKIASGLKSFSIDGFSESFAEANKQPDLSTYLNPMAKQYLLPYLNGGFDICGDISSSRARSKSLRETSPLATLC